MSQLPSSDFPDSFDPALHLHSDAAANTLIDATFSDDIEASILQSAEIQATKNQQGIVIQHRRWLVGEVFRSDSDHGAVTPTRHNRAVGEERAHRTDKKQPAIAALTSSPPAFNMPWMSSPVQYPASSSPPNDHSRKRRRVEDPTRSPLKNISTNTRLGGFLADSSDEEDDLPSKPQHKLPRISEREDDPRATTTSEVEHSLDAAGRNDLSIKQTTTTAVANANITEHNVTTTRPALGGSLLGPRTNGPQLSQVEAESPSAEATGISENNIRNPILVKTCAGKSVYIGERRAAESIPYEQLVASRSAAVEGHARTSYYGIDIHQLMDDMKIEAAEIAKNAPPPPVQQSIESEHSTSKTKGKTLMWTEKYRARKFTDLVGDERTHRQVLRWLKNWDSIVFPGSARPKKKASKDGTPAAEEAPHRKILMLTGPPGLGKTTLAHVCAKQAGYEVQEINASDERSGNVVRGRIKDMVGTENVRGVEAKGVDGKVGRKAGRPVCVIVDEVDGVVSGSGGSGEGGFVKALIDLVMLDQRNSSLRHNSNANNKGKRKGENFQLLRPLILICNDVYHPSLRPLRQSSLAEIIHIRKPALNMVISRVHSIFEKEGVPSDTDAVRRLCESTWGVTSRKGLSQGTGTADGDIRSIMVIGEWVATKLRALTLASSMECQRLTRPWLEEHVLNDLSPGGGAARCLGRGGAKDVVDRVFQLGAGFPALSAKEAAHQQSTDVNGQGVIGVAEAEKRRAMDRLREMVAASGDTERIMTDCFTNYPIQPIQDDTFLSKPCAAYEWLDFHDRLQSQLISSQDWELAPYLSSPVLGFHHLFASSASARAAMPSHNNGAWSGKSRFGVKDDTDAQNPDSQEHELPFSGPSAPFAAMEAQKANAASIQTLQSGLSLPLARMYHSPPAVATELLPYVLRMLAPDIKPVIVNTSSTSAASGARTSIATASVRKASEKLLVNRAVRCMAATGLRFEKTRVENDRPGPGGHRASGGYVFRMEPAVDVLGGFGTMAAGGKTVSSSSVPGADSAPGGGVVLKKPGAEGAGVRYAVRQVLEQEWKREVVRLNEEARKKRMNGGVVDEEDEDEQSEAAKGKAGAVGQGDIATVAAIAVVKPKRDFFGRIIKEMPRVAQQLADGTTLPPTDGAKDRADAEPAGRVWVSFREGFSNAVKKPITMEEFMRGL